MLCNFSGFGSVVLVTQFSLLLVFSSEFNTSYNLFQVNFSVVTYLASLVSVGPGDE